MSIKNQAVFDALRVAATDAATIDLTRHLLKQKIQQAEVAKGHALEVIERELCEDDIAELVDAGAIEYGDTRLTLKYLNDGLALFIDVQPPTGMNLLNLKPVKDNDQEEHAHG